MLHSRFDQFRETPLGVQLEDVFAEPLRYAEFAALARAKVASIVAISHELGVQPSASAAVVFDPGRGAGRLSFEALRGRRVVSKNPVVDAAVRHRDFQVNHRTQPRRIIGRAIRMAVEATVDVRMAYSPDLAKVTQRISGCVPLKTRGIATDCADCSSPNRT